MDLICTLVIACAVFFLVSEIFGDMFGEIIYGIIGIAVVVGVLYGLYVGVRLALLACYRFICEHPVIFWGMVLVVAALVLLIIFFWNCGNNHRLLTTDYTELIDDCDRNIASATEALARARKAEENYRRCNQFEMLEPGRHKYGYNPNEFEREVDQCENTLNRLKDEKQYYEEQRRKADKLRRSLR